MKVSDSSTYLEAAALKGDTNVTIESVRPIGKEDIGTDGRPMNKKNVIITYKGVNYLLIFQRQASANLKRRLAVVCSAWLGLLGCADTQNLKNMSAREIQAAINTPLYEEGTVERAWEDAFWDEKLSYRIRNEIGDVLYEYQLGRITSKESFLRIKAIRNSSPKQ